MQQVSPHLQSFIEKEIIPRYAAFDKAHREDHALAVIEQSLSLAPHYEVCTDMVYAIAAYHDLGLQEDRKTHHLVSGRIIREDLRLREWFTPEQVELMAQAAEDHRASSDHEPRSIYGKIVAEADRLIDTDTIVRRTVQYGFKHYPGLSREEHIQRALSHLDEKYAEGGYLKLWIPESPNAGRLRALQQLIKDRAKMRSLVEEAYERETQPPTYLAWIGGSCDYGHKERAGAAAVVMEKDGKAVGRDVIADLHTTEFRMMLTLMAKVMNELPEGADITFLTNAAYIQNFDKTPTAKSANPDLIVQCIEAKHRHRSVGVRIVQYHKSPLLIETHNASTEAMKKLRSHYNKNK